MASPQDNDARARQLIDQMTRATSPNHDAVEALIALGEGAIGALSEAIDTAHEPTQRAVTIALSRLNTRRALATMLNAVITLEDNPELASTLLYAASELLRASDKDRVRPLLLRCVQHTSPAVRLAAIDCLQATKDRKALSAIQKSHSHVASGGRNGGALHEAPTHLRAPAAHTTPRAASLQLIQQLGSQRLADRKRAQQELRDHPDRDRVVIEHLYHPNPHLRESILELAAQLQHPPWHTALIDIATDCTRPTAERILALRGVLQLSADGGTSETSRVVQLLEHQHAELRAQAARLIATSHAAHCRQRALDLLQTDIDEVRQRASEGWAHAANASRQRDIPQVLAILRSVRWLRDPASGDVETCRWIHSGIIGIIRDGGFVDASVLDELAGVGFRGNGAIETLTRHTLSTLSESTGIATTFDDASSALHALYRDDLDTRLHALEELRRGDTSTLRAIIAPFIRYLYTASTKELHIAIDVLEASEHPRALQAIQRLSHHRDPDVRTAARRSLTVRAQHLAKAANDTPSAN